VRDSWPEILEVVENSKMSAWVVLQTAQARALNGDVLTVSFVSELDANNFKQPTPGADSVSEQLRSAILQVLGLRVKFIARVENAAPEQEPPPRTEPEIEPGGWAVASIPASEPVAAERVQRPAPASQPKAPSDKRYGESVVREVLNATFIEEQPLAPRVVPRPQDD